MSVASATAASLGLSESNNNVTVERTDVADGTVARITPAPAAPDNPIEVMQRELDLLRSELDAVRRRDDMLQFYMRRLDEELRLAARVQQDFLPKSLPHIGSVKFHTLFRPAAHVSGDLYDVTRLDETHIGFYMADAVGHGMPAALLTMFLKQALVTKEILPKGYRLLDPSQTMLRLNMALVGQNLTHASFATAIYGHINCKTREVTFARGGHPNPVLLPRDGEMSSVEAQGPLLGIFPDEPFEQTTITLAPGDRLFIVSDGIELAFNNELHHDSQHWRQELWSRRELSTEQIIREFAEHVDRADVQGQGKKDDLTVIAIEVER
jgi:sigma-B regulation protein RsbU (phosphoserine phosphatase)